MNISADAPKLLRGFHSLYLRDGDESPTRCGATARMLEHIVCGWGRGREGDFSAPVLRYHVGSFICYPPHILKIEERELASGSDNSGLDFIMREKLRTGILFPGHAMTLLGDDLWQSYVNRYSLTNFGKVDRLTLLKELQSIGIDGIFSESDARLWEMITRCPLTDGQGSSLVGYSSSSVTRDFDGLDKRVGYELRCIGYDPAPNEEHRYMTLMKAGEKKTV
jgi:hypothetical protein